MLSDEARTHRSDISSRITRILKQQIKPWRIVSLSPYTLSRRVLMFLWRLPDSEYETIDALVSCLDVCTFDWSQIKLGPVVRPRLMARIEEIKAERADIPNAVISIRQAVGLDPRPDRTVVAARRMAKRMASQLRKLADEIESQFAIEVE